MSEHSQLRSEWQNGTLRRMGRIRDAVLRLIVELGARLATLWRGTPQYQATKMRLEWSELQLELTAMLEQLNAWAARVAKRDARRARKSLEPEQPELPKVPIGAHPKSALWELAGRRGLTHVPAIAERQNGGHSESADEAGEAE